jgi:hypothetical protein
MERGNSVSRCARQIAMLVLLLCAAPSAFANERLVLIVSADSHIEQLDSLEVRKLFLGLTVNHNGHRLRPLLNEADPHLKEIFLQNIVSMSDITYDRHLLGLALKQGRTQPITFKDDAKLISALIADSNAVSFAWIKGVERDSRIRILRVLWHD